MKVFISQSNYIPWCGFIDLIDQSDIYIVYDTMQYTKNDWRNRNLIRNGQACQWLSIPCGSSISRAIDEVYSAKPNWYKKHISTLTHCYRKSKYWPHYGEKLINTYNQLQDLSLSEVNILLLKFILSLQGIDTPNCQGYRYYRKKNLVNLERTERLVHLCKTMNASTYISAPAAKNYLDVEQFNNQKIQVEFYSYPSYPSQHQFPNPLSCIDSFMLEGKLPL